MTKFFTNTKDDCRDSFVASFYRIVNLDNTIVIKSEEWFSDDLILSDGVHPNEKGVDILFKVIADKVIQNEKQE